MISKEGSSLYCCGSSVSMSGDATRSTLWGSAAASAQHDATSASIGRRRQRAPRFLDSLVGMLFPVGQQRRIMPELQRLDAQFRYDSASTLGGNVMSNAVLGALLAALALGFAASAEAQVRIGVTVSATGPASSPGIPSISTIPRLQQTIPV